MSAKSPNNTIKIPVTILFLQLIFLFIIKYSNQDLSLANFSFFKTGNLLNTFLYTGILVALILSVKKNLLNNKNIFSFLIVSWLILLLAFLSTKVKIFSENEYIYYQPVNKILSGFLFLIYLIFLLYFFLYLLSRIFNKERTKIIKLVFRTFLLLLIFFIIIIIYIDNAGYSFDSWAIKKDKNNIAVVLGAAVWTGNIPSPTLSSRVDKAIELYNSGFVGKIILTGGKAPGELSESEAAFEYAKASGADSSIFIIEKSTSSSTDQIRWIKVNFNPVSSDSEIIIVSDAYHLPRVIEISKFFNLKVKVAESFHKLNFEDLVYNKLRESLALFIFWNFAL